MAFPCFGGFIKRNVEEYDESKSAKEVDGFGDGTLGMDSKKK